MRLSLVSALVIAFSVASLASAAPTGTTGGQEVKGPGSSTNSAQGASSSDNHPPLLISYGDILAANKKEADLKEGHELLEQYKSLLKPSDHAKGDDYVHLDKSFIRLISSQDLLQYYVLQRQTAHLLKKWAVVSDAAASQHPEPKFILMDTESSTTGDQKELNAGSSTKSAAGASESHNKVINPPIEVSLDIIVRTNKKKILDRNEGDRLAKLYHKRLAELYPSGPPPKGTNHVHVEGDQKWGDAIITVLTTKDWLQYFVLARHRVLLAWADMSEASQHLELQHPESQFILVKKYLQAKAKKLHV